MHYKIVGPELHDLLQFVGQDWTKFQVAILALEVTACQYSQAWSYKVTSHEYLCDLGGNEIRRVDTDFRMV